MIHLQTVLSQLKILFVSYNQSMISIYKVASNTNIIINNRDDINFFFKMKITYIR